MEQHTWTILLLIKSLTGVCLKNQSKVMQYLQNIDNISGNNQFQILLKFLIPLIFSMKSYLYLHCLLFLLGTILCNNSIYYDGSATLSTSAYQCMKQSGNNVMQILVANPPQGIPQAQITKIANAKNAGIEPEVVVTPCIIRYVQQQGYNINKAWGSLVKKVWLRPFTSVEGGSCSWKINEPGNCGYLKYVIQNIQNYGLQVGVYADSVTWTQIFGTTQCPDVNTTLLYWLPKGKADDGQQNFNSYTFDKVGGWTKPSVKTYSNRTICNYQVNLNYFQ